MPDEGKPQSTAAQAPAVEEAGPSPTKPAKQPAPAFPQADAAKKAEQVAKKAKIEVSEKAVPTRQYLESTVVPILMQGMQELTKERPDDPVQYLAAYLIKHNPKKSADKPAEKQTEKPAEKPADRPNEDRAGTDKTAPTGRPDSAASLTPAAVPGSDAAGKSDTTAAVKGGDADAAVDGALAAHARLVG